MKNLAKKHKTDENDQNDETDQNDEIFIFFSV